MWTHKALIVTTAAVLGLSACGGSSGDSTQDSVAPAVAASDTTKNDAPITGAAFNEADVSFSQGMIPHHESAIEMSDIALDPAVGAGPEVQALAKQIKAAQDPEIKQMTALLTTWAQPVSMEMTPEEMASMDGMMSMEDMDALGALTGAEFDKAWAAMMIEHHNGAITMAQTVKAAGSNPEILALAEAIIAGQSAEIATLQPIAG